MTVRPLAVLAAIVFSIPWVQGLTAQSTAGSGQPTSVSQPSTPAEEERIRAEVARQLAEAEKKPHWTFGLKPNGGGFAITSPDERLQFRLLGYAQAVATLTNSDFTNSFGNGDLRIRRARVGWLTTFDKKYELFIEYDGVPQTGNLVEARLNWQLKGDDVQLRVGKFVVPFSEEGWRSSRNYDTVERFLVINSIYGLPALDTQFGAMLHGQLLPDNRLQYFVGAWNGNAAAAENNRDNNGEKEFQAKVAYKFTKELRAGVGLDLDTEEKQTLRLNSLTGTRFASVDVEGARHGLDADFLYEKGRVSFRGETMMFDFGDSDASLGGGFLQAAYFTRGNYDGGFQPLLRLETARLKNDRVTGAARSSRIDAVTAGFNWYLNNNVRVQCNAIGEHFNRDAGQSVHGSGWKPSLLTELQMRF